MQSSIAFVKLSSNQYLVEVSIEGKSPALNKGAHQVIKLVTPN